MEALLRHTSPLSQVHVFFHHELERCLIHPGCDVEIVSGDHHEGVIHLSMDRPEWIAAAARSLSIVRARGCSLVKLSRRLTMVEKTVAMRASLTDAREEQWAQSEQEREAAWQVMRSTMREEHARLVVEAYAAGYQYVDSPGFNTPAGRLLRRCLDGLNRRTHWPYSDIPDEVAFAMPPQVAEVYLTHGDSLALHDCEGCGYKLPHGRFEACPLCGGRIGWYAYFLRRKMESEQR